MARKLRLEMAGAVHLGVNRGNTRAAVFAAGADPSIPGGIPPCRHVPIRGRLLQGGSFRDFIKDIPCSNRFFSEINQWRANLPAMRAPIQPPIHHHELDSSVRQ
jgi:hypothetical protein